MTMQGLRSLLPVLAFAVLYAAVSLSVSNSYYQLVLTLVPVWAVFGLSWNLLSGYTGLISFGHAAFFGIGAYATALGQIYFDLSPWLSIPIAAMLGGIAGLLIGFPTFRLQGHYFALAMLAYPLAILYVFEWLGFQEITLPIKRDNPIAYMQFGDPRLYTLLALAMMVATILLTRVVERSRFGMALLAIKQNAAAAEAAGINTLAWKLRAITLSGAGIRTGADGRNVRRRRHGVGSGDRIGDPDPAGRDTQCRGRCAFSRNTGRDLRPRYRLRDPACAGRIVLEAARFVAEALGLTISRASSGAATFGGDRGRNTTTTGAAAAVVGSRRCRAGGSQPVTLLWWIEGRTGRQLQASQE
jgi:branched-subunit amino acid transport system permease